MLWSVEPEAQPTVKLEASAIEILWIHRGLTFHVDLDNAATPQRSPRINGGRLTVNRKRPTAALKAPR
jgi:hypothetical protein